MRTIRRLYVYAVALISLELVTWGLINLLQTSLSAAPGTATNLLASGLALVLVGLPIFALHGWLAQREAARDPQERDSRLRALFHYAARFALLAPAAMNLYFLAYFYLSRLLGYAPLGGLPARPSALDNLIVIVISALAWLAMEALLRRDWRIHPASPALVEVRRFSRYLWMLYGLAFGAAGVTLLLRFIVNAAADPGGLAFSLNDLCNGLSFTLVFGPIWAFWWRLIQRTREDPGERPSILRLVILYFLALLGAVILLVTGENALQALLQALLEGSLQRQAVQAASPAATAALVFGVLGAYFGHWRQAEQDGEPDQLRQAGLRRLYHYPLALAGAAATFAGIFWVLDGLVSLLVAAPVQVSSLSPVFARGLAWLAFGLPFWGCYWPEMQDEARLPGDNGDHARRSVVRKTVLYLVIFLCVVGIMSSAGVLFYRLINAALGSPGEALALAAWQQVRSLVLLAAWLMYHFSALRADGRLALSALGERQASFPVLVLQMGSDPFYAALGEALGQQAPRLPATFVEVDPATPPAALPPARAVVLPAALALNPPAGWGERLAAFDGARVVAPLPAEGWLWAGQAARPEAELARETALAIRQLAEGQRPRPGFTNNPWLVAGIAFGAVFALLAVFILISALFNGF